MSSISTKSYLASKNITKGMFISNWQDEKTTNYVSLNGIKDNAGKFKLESYSLSNKWNALNLQIKMPPIKILLPAVTIWPNTSATYHALIYEDKQWNLTDKLKRFNFRWELIKYDEYENPIEVIDIGTGNSVNVSIPKAPSRYKIRLYTAKDSIVSIVQSKLNIPLKPVN